MKNEISRAGAALVIAVTLLGACRELVGDPSFDRWCGDKLCSWDLDEGRIEQVASWHARDYAVALVETPTQLSQLSESGAVECIRFELIVDAEARAELSLGLDFNADGTVDYSRALPSVRWKRLAFDVHAPAHYEKLRFVVRKAGEGRAVVAQLRAREGGDCTGPRIELQDQLPGAPCREHSECSFKLCTEQRCSECREDADCGDAALCVSGACSPCRNDADCAATQRCVWREAVSRGAGRTCIAQGERLERGLRELCDRDADCVGMPCGIDDGAARSCGLACADDGGCPDGLTCRTLVDTHSTTWTTLPVCVEPSAAGGPCERDGDCASGRCCDAACAAGADGACD